MSSLSKTRLPQTGICNNEVSWGLFSCRLMVHLDKPFPDRHTREHGQCTACRAMGWAGSSAPSASESLFQERARLPSALASRPLLTICRKAAGRRASRYSFTRLPSAALAQHPKALWSQPRHLASLWRNWEHFPKPKEKRVQPMLQPTLCSGHKKHTLSTETCGRLVTALDHDWVLKAEPLLFME